MITYWTERLGSQRSHYGPPEIAVVTAADHNTMLDKMQAQVDEYSTKYHNMLLMLIAVCLEQGGKVTIPLSARMEVGPRHKISIIEGGPDTDAITVEVGLVPETLEPPAAGRGTHSRDAVDDGGRAEETEV